MAKGFSLINAHAEADSEPGVYILYYDCKYMKCGRAISVKNRLNNYLKGRHDEKSRKIESWGPTTDNVNNITVDFQHCPESKMAELEGKLVCKYGKGPWMSKTAKDTNQDSWPLLI